MTFEEKVKFLRAQSKFKVTPLPEVRAIAFAAKEKSKPAKDDLILFRASPKASFFTLSSQDVQKILREYPTLATKFL